MSPCSTSDDVQVALNYSKENDHRVIFKIVTHGFMERGAPLQWLSAFPGESEFLYPPLTYLKPTGVEESFDVEGVHITALGGFHVRGTRKSIINHRDPRRFLCAIVCSCVVSDCTPDAHLPLRRLSAAFARATARRS